MKFKYGAIVFSGLLGVSAILAACGTRGKFDQIDDGKIKLASSLTSKGAANALQAIVKKYNEVKKPGDYPIEITQIAGGYDQARVDLQSRVGVKDKTNFYNLILNYPDVVSVLARNQMELPFDGVDVSKISPNFLNFNERISGVSKKANYAIPVSVSTDILVLNGPVLHYILNSAKGESKGAQKDNKSAEVQRKSTGQKTVTQPLTIATDSATNGLWKKIEDAAKVNGKKKEEKKSTRSKRATEGTQTTKENTGGDAATSDTKIKESWGAYQEVEGGLKGYQFKAIVFENWHDLIDFSTRVAKSFSKVKDNSNKKGNEIQGVLGVDNSPNALLSSVFAAGNSDYNNFFYKVQNGRADFSNFNNKGSSYQNLKNVFNDYKNLIAQNGLYVNKGGSYSSNFQKFHQLAYSISSTSGFAYSFAGQNSKRFKFTDDGTFVEYPSYTTEVNAPESNNGNDGKQQGQSDQGNLLGTFEVVDKSTSDIEVKPKTQAESKKSSDSKQTANTGKGSNSKQQTPKKTISLYKTKIPQDKTENVDAFLVTDSELISKLEKAKNKKEETKASGKSASARVAVQATQKKQSNEKQIVGYTTTSALSEDGKHIFKLGKLNSENYERKIIVGATVETLEQSTTLQSEEAIVLAAPGKYKDSDQKRVMITQGPNLIGVHANTKENEETKKFVNWFLNKTESWEVKGNGKDSQTTKSLTPAQYFAESASYILPLKETVEKDHKEQTNKNTYVAKALEMLKEVSENKSVSYSDPSDFRSGRFRDALGANFNATINSKANFEKFFQGFKAALGSDFDK